MANELEQQPGAQAPNRVRTEVYEDGKWHTLCVYGFSRPTAPPPLPEGVSEEDVLLAAATWRAGATFREILESFLTRLKTTNVG